MKKTESRPSEESVERYDWSKGVRGKHAAKAAKASALLRILEPDLARRFKDSRSVNTALRRLLELADAVSRRS